MNLKFHMHHDQTAGLQTCKSQLVENPKWPPILKITKPLKSIFLQNGLAYLAEILYVILVGPWCSVISKSVAELPYLPYIFGRIKIIIFFTVRTFNLVKKYKFFSVRIFMNAEKLPIIEGIHRYICGNFSVHTDRCENKQFV